MISQNLGNDEYSPIHASMNLTEANVHDDLTRIGVCKFACHIYVYKTAIQRAKLDHEFENRLYYVTDAMATCWKAANAFALG